MSKTITVSDKTWKKIKDQVEKEKTEVKEKKDTKIQIKTLAGEVLYESSKTTLKEAVVEAVDEGAYLEGAYLRGADLRGADLGDANLRDADLGDADLRGADFYNTKFYGKSGTTKIKQNQLNDFLKALGVIVE